MVSEKRRHDPLGDEWLAAALRGRAPGSPGDADGRAAAPRAGPCPDAELLAAYVEGHLEPAERTAVERHAAACGRCLDTLGVIATSLEADRLRPSAPEQVWWWRRWSTWLVPATAAATALGLYLMVRPPQPGPSNEQSADAEFAARQKTESGPAHPAEAEAPTPAASRGTAPAAEGPGLRTTETDARRREGPSGKASSAESPRLMARSAEETTIGAARAPERRVAPTDREAPPAVLQEPKRAENVAPAPIPEVVADAAAPAPPAAAAPAAVSPAVPAAPVSAGRADAGAGPAKSRALSRAMVAGAIEARSPTGDTWWRFAPGPTITVSRDQRATWQPAPLAPVARQSRVTSVRSADAPAVPRADEAAPQRDVPAEAAVAAPTRVLAVAAVSDTVCWAVGTGGLVMVTIDGIAWTSRAFLDQSDLVEVQASDAGSAVVTTREGRRHATADGGATWRPER